MFRRMVSRSYPFVAWAFIATQLVGACLMWSAKTSYQPVRRARAAVVSIIHRRKEAE